MNFLFGVQRLLGEEITFASNEMLARSQTETHPFSEFPSRMAEAHSVTDIGTMHEVFGQHRRDCERLLKYSQRVVDSWSRLFCDQWEINWLATTGTLEQNDGGQFVIARFGNTQLSSDGHLLAAAQACQKIRVIEVRDESG